MSAVSAIAIGLLLPTVLRSRHLARNQQCDVNLKQIALALHNYHSAFNTLPAGCGGTTGGEDTNSNQGRLGPLIAILPFIEQQKLWEEISNPSFGAKTKRMFPPMGPAPWYDPTDYRPWSAAPTAFLCPDSDGPAPEPVAGPPIVVTTLAMPPGMDSDYGSLPGMMTNYVACFGDGTHMQGELLKKNDQSSVTRATRDRAASRGIFSSSGAMKFRDCLDGLSNTLLYSESISGEASNAGLAKIAINVSDLSRNPSLCLAAHQDANAQWWDVRRGGRWCDGALAITGFQTVLPPNSPSCLSENGIDEPIASVSSHHAGGVHVLFADGRVAFIGNEIDCGDTTQPGVSNGDGYTPAGSGSPYGVWGALGSRANRETVDVQPHLKPFRASGHPRNEDFTHRWTDNTGKINLTAKFVRLIDKVTVELEDTTGILHRVPLNTLSDQDIIIAVELSFAAQP
jgi:prepilin-type processing-associated H-X9-DG protein